jgi:hypothetical protein
MDSALMEARLRAFYGKHNPGNDQNMYVVVFMDPRAPGAHLFHR